MDDNSAMALLTRVIQRIHSAGLLLHASTDDSDVLRDAESALDELERALVDIRVTVLSWEIAPMAIGPLQPGQDVDAAVAHLRLVAGTLNQIAAREPDGDGPRWMAANEARHSVHRALMVLRDTELAAP